MMRSSLVALAALGTLSCLAAAACTSSDAEDSGAGESEVGTKNLTSHDFGLTDKEVVLTLDDGPGPRTVELAEFLLREHVPAVFFMVGKNAKANPEAVKRVAELSAQSGSSLIIGNHSMTHTTPLTRQGVDGSIAEIMNADAILAPNIEKAQSALPSTRAFFRPPYGAFTALGSANIARINAAGAEKYTGPVFWDIGGELTDHYSADWACWGKKVTMDRCMDGYIAETRAHGKGIILAHDVHSKTVDMLMGTGSANGRSLIKELRSQGYKFVSIRAHDDALQQSQDARQQLSASTAVSIDAHVTAAVGGHVIVDVQTTNAVKAVAQFDNMTTTAIEFSGNRSLDMNLPAGSHYVTVTALDAAGVAQGQQRYTFVVPSAIEANSIEAQNDAGAVCVNFDLMKAGQPFRLYHGKVACNAPGAVAPPGSSECYKYTGDLKTTRDPSLVGPAEWSVDLDLTYASDPNDKSKLALVFDANDGDIHTGARYARSASLPDVPMNTVSTDCAHGEWRGNFTYANGQAEDFVLRMVRPAQANGRINYRE